jgi:hypothetical protein
MTLTGDKNHINIMNIIGYAELLYFWILKDKSIVLIIIIIIFINCNWVVTRWQYRTGKVRVT